MKLKRDRFIDSPLDGIPERVYGGEMKRIYDIDDRAFLPWRFYGQSLSITAGL